MYGRGVHRSFGAKERRLRMTTLLGRIGIEGKHFMTTSAAENTAGRAENKDKEKVEKRRALGRGLESLLPGPRVVGGAAVRPVGPPAGNAVPAVTPAPRVSTSHISSSPISVPPIPAPAVAP